MEGKPDERSQPILRVPRDKTPAELTLADGEQRYVLLYIPPGDKLAHMFDDPSAFFVATDGGGTRFIARSAVACITTHVARAGIDEFPPQERQPVVVKLRAGTSVRGELRWSLPFDRRRTLDHLNEIARFIAVFDGDYVHFVAKDAVLTVEEA